MRFVRAIVCNVVPILRTLVRSRVFRIAIVVPSVALVVVALILAVPKPVATRTQGDARKSTPRLHGIERLLIAGDSLSQPLDIELDARLRASGVKTKRNSFEGSAISPVLKGGPPRWNVKLATSLVDGQKYNAVVMFLGVNEDSDFVTKNARIPCCEKAWVDEYARQADSIIRAFLLEVEHVYWLTVPAPRAPNQRQNIRAVNAGIRRAVAKRRREGAHLIDLHRLFTPGGRFRSTMPIDGTQTLVREVDGKHLNSAGAKVAVDVVIGHLASDFGP